MNQIIARNLAAVRERIAKVAARSGRPADSVELIAVTKYAPPGAIAALLELGVTQFGENRVQQLAQRVAEYGAVQRGLHETATRSGVPNWHMIGHLQRNKVRALLDFSRVVHSLDSIRLADALDAAAEERGTRVDVLVEVNMSGEAAKTGIAPADAVILIEHLHQRDHLRLTGLMTMAALTPNASDAQPTFAALREMLESLRSRRMVGSNCTELSMGMSHDFDYAIAEGATLIRVGSSLFEGLPPPGRGAPA
ncbi:MAG: YggS family pyridoxal phosphate-dependent enzyme [Phycisphaerales bacterium]|nr:YggS family pyridoxal phosphate-dependent enzyme [Phycisphaerales bacterium]